MEKDNYSIQDLYVNTKYSDCTVTIQLPDYIPETMLNIVEKLPPKTIKTHKMILGQLKYFDMIIQRETKTDYTFKTMFPTTFERIIKSLHGFDNSETLLIAKEYLMELWCKNELSLNIPLKELLYVGELDSATFDINLFTCLADILDYVYNENVMYIIRENLDKLNTSCYDDKFINIVKSSSIPVMYSYSDTSLINYSLSEKNIVLSKHKLPFKNISNLTKYRDNMFAYNNYRGEVVVQIGSVNIIYNDILDLTVGISFIDDSHILIVTVKKIIKFNFIKKSDIILETHTNLWDAKADNESIHDKFICYYNSKSYFLLNKKTFEITKNITHISKHENIIKLTVVGSDVYYYTIDYDNFKTRIYKSGKIICVLNKLLSGKKSFSNFEANDDFEFNFEYRNFF